MWEKHAFLFVSLMITSQALNFQQMIQILKEKLLDANGYRVKLQIWDTADQERFKAIAKSYYKDVHGILLVYDITNLESFKNLNYWLDEIKTNELKMFIKYCQGINVIWKVKEKLLQNGGKTLLLNMV